MPGDKSVIHVKNIQNQNEKQLEHHFGIFGRIMSTQIVRPKSGQSYALITFNDASNAQAACQSKDTAMYGYHVTLAGDSRGNDFNGGAGSHSTNWGGSYYQSKKDKNSDGPVQDHYHIYVGEFGPEMDNAKLKESFEPFGTVLHAKVILDTQTQTSKGYGFVTYSSKDEAENAIKSMNGKWIGYSTIRVNWATRKLPNTSKPLSYDALYKQTSPTNRTVYIGNLDIHVPDEAVRDLCSKHGTISDIKLHTDRGYGFVKYASKDEACRAIVQMNGEKLCNVVLKCSWGKEDHDSGSSSSKSQQLLGSMAAIAGSTPYGAGNSMPSYNQSAYGSMTASQQSQMGGYQQQFGGTGMGNAAAANYMGQQSGASATGSTDSTQAQNSQQQQQMSMQQMYMLQLYYQQQMLAQNPQLAQQYQQAMAQQQQQASQQSSPNGSSNQQQQQQLGMMQANSSGSGNANYGANSQQQQQQPSQMPNYWNNSQK